MRDLIGTKSKTYWKAFNTKVPIRVLLIELGVSDEVSNSVYCPFHRDKSTGHKSATIIDQSNILWCFSERRQYRPSDALKLLGNDPEQYAIKYFGTTKSEDFDDLRLEITDDEKIQVLKGEVSVPDLYEFKCRDVIRIEHRRDDRKRLDMIDYISLILSK